MWQVGEEIAVKMYKTMVKLNVMDTVLYDAQRQVHCGFLTCGMHLWSGYALTID